MTRLLLAALGSSLALLLAGCSSPDYADLAASKDYGRELPPGMKGLRKIDPSKYPDFSPGWESRFGMIQSIDQSALYMSRPSSQAYFPYLDIPHDRAEASLRAFKDDLRESSSGADLNRRVRERYEVYESIGWNGDGEMLFTAYHEPIYQGSLTPTAQFRYPIYRRPKELQTDETGEKSYVRGADGSLRPAPARGPEMDTWLAGQGLELVYLSDAFEAYVVQVQGSARFHLTDGRELRVGYAGDNGHEYRPVWKPLVDSGKLAKHEVSLQRLKDYFAAHPNEMEPSIRSNPRFVFFTERTGPAVGCLNVPVTPWHSIATDRNRVEDVFPRAAIAFLNTQLARSPGARESAFAGFVCDQDRGGAIRSAGRADLFLGTGDIAEALAGRTRAEGRMWYIALKPELVPPVIAQVRAEQQAARASAKPAAATRPPAKSGKPAVVVKPGKSE